ncbi:hypothetical protein D1007_27953 [Hordeum vulgare]|nr:hypothetical protein D1007_27953 [Hordeum vulgare]
MAARYTRAAVCSGARQRLQADRDEADFLVSLVLLPDRHKDGQKKTEQAISRFQESVTGWELGVTSGMLFVND